MENVEPTLGLLDMLTLPPRSSAIFLLNDSPNPVPRHFFCKGEST